MHQTPTTRDGDERPLPDEPMPDRPASTGFIEPAPLPEAQTEPRAEVLPAAPALNTAATTEADDAEVLFGADDAEKFRLRWRELQADFVDDPKHAVEGADDLVAEVMRTLSETFAEHKRDLEGQWRDGGETEDLRVALRRYRSFFEQLLNA